MDQIQNNFDGKSTLYSRRDYIVIINSMPANLIRDPWPKIKSTRTNVCDRHVLMCGSWGIRMGDFTKPPPEKSGTSINHINHTHVFTQRKIKRRVRYNVKRFGRNSGIRDMRAEVILTKEMCQGLEKVLVFCCTRDMCDRRA
jgi:hypothetical protein